MLRPSSSCHHRSRRICLRYIHRWAAEYASASSHITNWRRANGLLGLAGCQALASFRQRLLLAPYARLLIMLAAACLCQDSILLHFLVKAPQRSLEIFVIAYGNFSHMCPSFPSARWLHA